MRCQVIAATPEDLDELATVATATFALACPPGTRPEDIADFTATELSAARFADYLADPARLVLTARNPANGPIVGYAMLIRGAPADPDVRRAVPNSNTAELSKCYVVPEQHGGAVASALMNAAVEHARSWDADQLWLGVNQQNERAQRFYRKHGFVVAGTRTFQLGSRLEHDYVMLRTLAG